MQTDAAVTNRASDRVPYRKPLCLGSLELVSGAKAFFVSLSTSFVVDDDNDVGPHIFSSNVGTIRSLIRTKYCDQFLLFSFNAFLSFFQNATCREFFWLLE